MFDDRQEEGVDPTRSENLNRSQPIYLVDQSEDVRALIRCFWERQVDRQQHDLIVSLNREIGTFKRYESTTQIREVDQFLAFSESGFHRHMVRLMESPCECRIGDNNSRLSTMWSTPNGLFGIQNCRRIAMPQQTALEIVGAEVIARTQVGIRFSNGATIVLSADQLVEYTPVEAAGIDGEDPIEV